MTSEQRFERVSPDHPPTTHPERSTGSLLRELTTETVTLFRQEVALAKQEMTETAHTVLRNSISVAIGGAVAFTGLLLLLAAAAYGLYAALNAVIVWYHAMWLAPLIVGVIVGIVGYVMIQKGITTLKRQRMVPEKTVQSMRENKEWLKNEIR